MNGDNEIRIGGERVRLVESPRGSWSAFVRGQLVDQVELSPETKRRTQANVEAWRQEMSLLRVRLIKRLRTARKNRRQ